MKKGRSSAEHDASKKGKKTAPKRGGVTFGTRDGDGRKHKRKTQMPQLHVETGYGSSYELVTHSQLEDAYAAYALPIYISSLCRCTVNCRSVGVY
jgi:hypothetical protein